MYKVTTWNINGLRSAKDLKSTLDDLDSDIICIQETKITREMLTEPLAILPGYTSYFDFSRRRSGYSGVATYCRQSATPVSAEAGVAGSAAGADGSVGCYGELAAELEPTERRELDSEGRCMVTLHRTHCQCTAGGRPCHVAVLNVYCPRADPDRPERLVYKLLFYRALRLRAAALRAAGHHVLLVGDLNCSHRPIDSCDPGDLEEFAASPSRRFLDGWLCEPPAAGAAAPDRLVDLFRLFHPSATEVYTCWNTQRAARQLNFGTRIDYVLSDAAAAAAGLPQRCDVLADVQGSDHCPVRAEMRGELVPASRPPPACTRFYPELAGRQLTIKDWCSRPPAEKRPQQQQSAQRQGKRPRGGQATLLGFVKRTSGPAKNGGGGGSAEEPKGVTKGGGTPSNEPCKSLAELSNSLNGKYTSDAASNGNTENSASVCNSESALRNETAADRLEPAPQSPASTGPSSQTDPNPSRQKVVAFWSETLRALKPPPCRGHREPCVQRVVKKPGPNLGKQFWCCARGVGKQGDPEARCGHFEWLRRGARARSGDVTGAESEPVTS